MHVYGGHGIQTITDSDRDKADAECRLVQVIQVDSSGSQDLGGLLLAKSVKIGEDEVADATSDITDILTRQTFKPFGHDGRNIPGRVILPIVFFVELVLDCKPFFIKMSKRLDPKELAFPMFKQPAADSFPAL